MKMRKILLMMLTLVSTLLIFGDIIEEPGFEHALVGPAYVGEQVVFVSDYLHVTNLGEDAEVTVIMNIPNMPEGWIMGWCFEYEGVSLCVSPRIPWTFTFAMNTTIDIDFTVVYNNSPNTVEFDLVFSAEAMEDFGMDFTYRTEDFVDNDNNEIVSGLQLRGNYPNPFNPETSIQYFLGEAGAVNLSIYDVKGRLINTLSNGNEAAGEHAVIWYGKNNAGDLVNSGVYFYKVESDIGTSTRKMILLK